MNAGLFLTWMLLLTSSGISANPVPVVTNPVPVVSSSVLPPLVTATLYCSTATAAPQSRYDLRGEMVGLFGGLLTSLLVGIPPFLYWGFLYLAQTVFLHAKGSISTRNLDSGVLLCCMGGVPG
jgi:hypothetical protein